MPYIGRNHIAGDHTSNFKVLDDISSYTATFDGSSTNIVSTADNTIRVPEHRFVQGQRVTYSNGSSSTAINVAVTVGVDNDGGQSTGVFYLDSVEKPANFALYKGNTYIFDQSDNSNEVYGGANHPLMFSTGPGGDHNGNGHYMSGVVYKLDGSAVTMAGYVSGFNAATSRTVEWTIPANAPAALYYWCHHHTGQGNSFAVSGTAISGLTSGTAYFVTFDTANTFKLATSLANANNNTNINLSSVGSGSSHTLTAAFDGVNTTFKITHGGGSSADIVNSAQLQIAINNVIQKANLDSSYTEGFLVVDSRKIQFKTAPTVDDIFWGNIIANSIETFDIADLKVDNFTGDGTTTQFTLSRPVPNNESLMVTIDGVLQHPSDKDTTRAYRVLSESVIEFSSPPPNPCDIQVRHLGFAGAATGEVSGFYGRTGNVVLGASDHITTGDITPRNINASGIVTASSFSGGFSGNIVGTSATFTGNLSVGGVLTYEDVTNVDSVGIITAQKDIHVGAGVSAVGVGTFGSLDIGGDIDVDGHTNLDNVSVAGVSTFSSELLITNDSPILRFTESDTSTAGRIIMSAGQLYIQAGASGGGASTGNGNIFITGYNGQETYAAFRGNGAVQLYHNNIKKFDTTGSGINITGTTDTDNLYVSGAATIKASALDTDFFSVIRQDHSSTKLFRIFQDSSSGGGAGGCHINTNNRNLMITANVAAGADDGLYLTTAGSIGINSTSPDRRFTLHQDATCRMNLKSLANSTAGIEFGDPDDHNIGYIVYDNTDNSMQFGVNAGERLRIGSTGTIDVSTTTNTSPTYIKINSNRSSADDTIGGLTGVWNGNPIAGINFKAGADTTNKDEGDIMMMTYDSGTPYERLRITSDGKFGFGTSSPDQTVHIHKGSAGSVSSTANTVLTLENSTTNILQFLNPNTAAAQVRFGDPQDDGAGFIEYSHSANTMSFGTNGPTRMQIDSNGHLGIAVASGAQLANSKQLTLRPTDDDGIRFVRPGDGNNVPNVHLDITTTTSGSALRSGGEAYTTKYHTYNCDMLFRSYLGGGTGGIIRFVTSNTDSGTQRFWQIDEDGMTTHRSRSTTAKTHEFSYTGGAGNSTLNVNLLSISGYSASSTAVVKIEYVGMYGLANAYISQGIWLCSYRRANGGSAANALAEQTHNGSNSSSSNVTMAWVGDNLRLTVGAYTGFTVHVTATVYNATINVLV